MAGEETNKTVEEKIDKRTECKRCKGKNNKLKKEMENDKKAISEGGQKEKTENKLKELRKIGNEKQSKNRNRTDIIKRRII